MKLMPQHEGIFNLYYVNISQWVYHGKPWFPFSSLKPAKNEIFYLDVEILPTTLGFVDIFKVGESISKLFCVETTVQKDFAKQNQYLGR